ncbi:MAG: threonine synthase [Chloroflexi bacterium]|nr:threonine synthase [Chloroflexota bacterium]|tara:strand:+ start:1345 stop:2397 length:1053 start_codon:yes stop_codon:yes gene_type:complete
MQKNLFNYYQKYLPINENTPFVSIGEGFTPLVKSENLSDKYNCNIFFKLEGSNPSGSFKDRGMFLTVAKTLEKKKKKIICASTGNTSASAAAYGARYNLETVVIIPKGNIALGKLIQAMAYGAKIISINGNFDESLLAVKEISDSLDFEIVNSINPYRLEGQKTAAFEIIEQLGFSPDFQFIPVGNAGNISSYWKGYKQFYDSKICNELPVLYGVQADGAAPLVDNKIIKNPDTIASAIRIGNPASADLAKDSISESSGEFMKVSDENILDAQKIIARKEGIFCELASAASVAGLIKLISKGYNFSNKNIVCILTGNGLKDPENAQQYLQSNIIKTSSDPDEIKEAILKY